MISFSVPRSKVLASVSVFVNYNGKSIIATVRFGFRKKRTARHYDPYAVHKLFEFPAKTAISTTFFSHQTPSHILSHNPQRNSCVCKRDK